MVKNYVHMYYNFSYCTVFFSGRGGSGGGGPRGGGGRGGPGAGGGRGGSFRGK